MSWLLVCGKEDQNLVSELEILTKISLTKHNFSNNSLLYLSKLNRSLSLSSSLGDGGTSNELLIEKLRSLCKFWEVDLTVGQTSSHRKYIGPVIVKCKLILFSVLRVLLKPAFEKQRNFNAQVIEFLAEVSKTR